MEYFNIKNYSSGFIMSAEIYLKPSVRFVSTHILSIEGKYYFLSSFDYHNSYDLLRKAIDSTRSRDSIKYEYKVNVYFRKPYDKYYNVLDVIKKDNRNLDFDREDLHFLGDNFDSVCLLKDLKKVIKYLDESMHGDGGYSGDDSIKLFEMVLSVS